MEPKIKILTTKLENQIKKMFETHLAIVEENMKDYTCEISKECQTHLCIVFNSVLFHSLYHTTPFGKLPFDKQEQVINELIPATKNHYKELYNWDGSLE